MSELIALDEATGETCEDVLNGIRDALETRNYFHMANGRDIGTMIDELELLRNSRHGKPDGAARATPEEIAADETLIGCEACFGTGMYQGLLGHNTPFCPICKGFGAALHSPKIAAAETGPGDAEAAFPAWTNEDEAYQLGRRDGYESAIQDIDIETGGDGEFKGSTIPGETVDVPTMKRRIIDRLDAKAEAKSQEPEAVAWLRNGSCDGSIPFALCDEDDEGAFPVYTHPTTKPEAPAVSVDAETLYSVFHSAYVKHGHGEIGTRAGITAIAALISGER